MAGPFPASDRIDWNDTTLRGLLEGTDGPVARDLYRRGLLVVSAAKNFATGAGGGPRVRTGRLRSSISPHLGRDAQGLFVDVGSNVEYARFVELGTKKPDGSQRNKPYPYLRPALPAADR